MAIKEASIHDILAGKDCFWWMGTSPAVFLGHPEQLKDVFSKIYDFQKLSANPLVKLLVRGVVNYDGNKWAMHRKIINPAFHMEKLKVHFYMNQKQKHLLF